MSRIKITTVFILVSAAAFWAVISVCPDETQFWETEVVKRDYRPLFEGWEEYFFVEIRRGNVGARLSNLFIGDGEAAFLDSFCPGIEGKGEMLWQGLEMPDAIPGRRLVSISEVEAAAFYKATELPEKWGVMLPGGLKVSFEPGEKLKGVAGRLWQNPELEALKENVPGALEGALESLQFELKIRF